MTLQLQLPEETIAALTVRALAEGRTAEAVAADALAALFADEELERQETLAGLRQSTQQFAAGQWNTPEQLDAALQARHV